MSYYQDYEQYEQTGKARGRFALIAFILIVVIGIVMVYAYILKSDKAEPSLPQSGADAQSLPGENDAMAAALQAREQITGETMDQILAAPDRPVRRAAATAGPSVVGVSNKIQWFNRQGNIDSVEQGSGSGIILSQDGYVVTNYHVIEGAQEVSVYLAGGEELPCEVIGYDSQTDIALLKITDDSRTYPAAAIGDSSKVEVGQLAIAIGNPLGRELEGTVTCGVISAVNRELTLSDGRKMTLLQTDAAISSGNSGGALINASGEVIGINTLKASGPSSSAAVEGIGFAIPMQTVLPIVEEIKQTGTVTRPGLAVSGQDMTASLAAYYQVPEGMYIAQVDETQGAGKAGVRAGDIITHVDDVRIESFQEMKQYLAQNHQIGDTVTLTVYRDETKQTLSFEVVLVGITG